MKIHYAEKGVVVNTIMDCLAEHQHLDELEEEEGNLCPDPAEFDMTDPNRKAQYKHLCRISTKYVKICEARNEIMIDIRGKFPAKTVERAQQRNADAFTSYTGDTDRSNSLGSNTHLHLHCSFSTPTVQLFCCPKLYNSTSLACNTSSPCSLSSKYFLYSSRAVFASSIES